MTSQLVQSSKQNVYQSDKHRIKDKSSGPGSSVGIVTELRAERSGDRIPVGSSFSAPVRTGPGANPASCTMGIGSFPGLRADGA